MVYKHGNWTLHEIEVNFKTIGKRKSYFFAKKKPKRGTPCDLPSGYEVGIFEKTGMPYLRFSGGKVSVWKKRKQGLI